MHFVLLRSRSRPNVDIFQWPPVKAGIHIFTRKTGGTITQLRVKTPEDDF